MPSISIGNNLASIDMDWNSGAIDIDGDADCPSTACAGVAKAGVGADTGAAAVARKDDVGDDGPIAASSSACVMLLCM